MSGSVLKSSPILTWAESHLTIIYAMRREVNSQVGPINVTKKHGSWTSLFQFSTCIVCERPAQFYYTTSPLSNLLFSIFFFFFYQPFKRRKEKKERSLLFVSVRGMINSFFFFSFLYPPLKKKKKKKEKKKKGALPAFCLS